MVRFIIVTFFFMGLGFYELSGGSDFEPIEKTVAASPEVKTEQLAVVEPKVVPNSSTPAAPTTLASAQKATPKESSLIVLAAVPTTQRLAGASSPTPKTEKTILGPKPSATSSTTETQANEVRISADTTVTFENADFRRVTGNRVNMRNGPGTQYSVVGKLLRDDEVEVLQDPGIGWVKLQVLETGRIGWMSAKLLTKTDY